MTEITLRRIAMVGFGEAGSILGAELAASGREVVTYDILLDSAGFARADVGEGSPGARANRRQFECRRRRMRTW